MEGMTSTRRAEKTVRGSHVFEISGYNLHRERLRDSDSLRSDLFTVGGYDWQIHLYPGGLFGGCREVAAYLFLKSKNNDIRVRACCYLSLVDVTGYKPPHTITGTHEFSSVSNMCWGHYNFIRRSELEGSPYLHDDRLTIECVIDVVKDVIASPEMPPSDITEHLGKLLQGKEDTDVIFDVDGEAFPAHKLVLAMRSPVFKAQLYGVMREKDMNRIIIGDMQPVVFEALLHFIYTDSLPAMDDLGRNDYIETTRHLLVAADRYAMERLKIICENILCEDIDVNTVVITLALADQHHCGRLKDACFELIASVDKMQIDDVVASQGCAELKEKCPVVFAELWEKTCRLGRSKSSLHIGSLGCVWDSSNPPDSTPPPNSTPPDKL